MPSSVVRWSICYSLFVMLLAALPAAANQCADAFLSGAADQYSFNDLVQSKVIVLVPMRGGTYARSDAVRYIILHSTETGRPADARRVIQSWSNRGNRHPGAQFVVDRDGTICSTVNPDMATVHIDTNKTLADYSNDNSIGIELVRSGKQTYASQQLRSVTCLVAYLQSRYNIADWQVTTHGRVQPSDRSDPVAFDLDAFNKAKSGLVSGNQTFALSSWQSRSVAPAPSLAHSSNTAAPRFNIQSVDVMPQPAPDFRMKLIILHP